MEVEKLGAGSPDRVNVLITSEKDTRSYCELDVKSETFMLKKVLNKPFPGPYGFVPKTHHIDAEPLDVLVLTDVPLKQGMVIQVRPIGLIRLRGNIPDDVLIADLVGDKKSEKAQDLLSLNQEQLEELKNFLEDFKGMKIENIFGAAHAVKSFEKAVELYKRKFE
jgi:inorganic pyrophosphatase